MPGTDLPYGETCLRVCRAVPGTEMACAAISLRSSYAVPGTHLGYAATRPGPALTVSQLRTWTGAQAVPGAANAPPATTTALQAAVSPGSLPPYHPTQALRNVQY
eukprot:2233998-Rhodomonas_salina.2